MVICRKYYAWEIKLLNYCIYYFWMYYKNFFTYTVSKHSNICRLKIGLPFLKQRILILWTRMIDSHNYLGWVSPWVHPQYIMDFYCTYNTFTSFSYIIANIFSIINKMKKKYNLKIRLKIRNSDKIYASQYSIKTISV